MPGFLACQAVGDSPGSTGGIPYDFGDAWTTVPEFEIGEGVGGAGAASFAPISEVRVLGGGDRVLIAEAVALRATIWTPDGTLVSEVGGAGEGPGEFTAVLFVQAHREGFYARDTRRFTSFSNNGTLIETIPFPPPALSFRGFGFESRALLKDGSVLAVPRISPAAMIGFAGDDPVQVLPVFRLWEKDGAWRMDTVVVLDNHNRLMSIVPEGRSMFDGGIQTEQRLGDYDLSYFDPVAGSVVVLRRNLGAGEVELVEIAADGDTTWNRRLSLPQVRLTPDQVAEYIDVIVERLVTRLPGPDKSGPTRAMRAAVKEALYVPDPLPGVSRIRGTTSGEIWVRGYQAPDTLSVWYAVDRRNKAARVRKVLLPSGVNVMDATDTHVWGLRVDALEIPYVVGLRLRPPAAQGSSPWEVACQA